MARAGIIFIVGLAFLIAAASSVNNRPIIGILTQPTDGGLASYGNAYIAASYVKYIESGGARVVPIFYNQTTAQLQALLGSLDGVLFPGGGAPFSGVYWNAAQTIWNYTLWANSHNDYFPLWGTCQGFEQISVLASQDSSILSYPYDSENYSIPLNFTSAASSSKLFGAAGKTIMNILTSEAVTMNNHQYGVAPAKFAANPYLPKMFNVLSTNVDRKGITFISTMEAFDMPITGSQWHPEKNAFEWGDEVINHSADAVLIAQYTSNYFVNQARNCAHTFPSVSSESAALIYNWAPLFSEEITGDFEQCYVWNLMV